MNVVLVVFDTLRKDAVGCYRTPPPWGPIATPNLDAFALESVVFTRAYPESLPTLCARRALYTGQRTYPFHNGDFRLKGDFVPAPGWGPIPEEQHTLSEILQAQSYRTALVSDLYHEFKPSKNFWRGFDQWTYVRGQETDPARSGPVPTQEECDRWVPRELQDARPAGGWFSRKILLNMRDRVREDQWTAAQVFQRAARWVEQNLDSRRFFLLVECFDPHEPWFVPPHYRRPYDRPDAQAHEQVISPYAEMPDLGSEIVHRTRANYSGLTTMCDRWFGHLIETLRATGKLDDSLVVVTSDHGHSLWDDPGYIGKRGYPSTPDVVDLPLIVRRPDRLGAGTTCDVLVQWHDIAPTILEALDVAAPEPTDGMSFWEAAFEDGAPIREHVTVGWGAAVSVVRDVWWLNAKIDATGVLLHDLSADDPFARNMADAEPEIARELFALAVSDARDGFPDYLMRQASHLADAPGCSPILSVT